ncbi:ead/Ea22-like family protein [Yersinia enterocolitica]|uniref:ead/Ea22-like family protein n=1 Tax=Yersinia enterocolitica TaxID=630 RepID=UPI00285AAEE6|nr:ead/Ea22-like family protein [Yersinia enterocolitica]HDV5954575.1 ead/Ea22-like family protein [Yersinia enterocolitica]HDV7154035.1 ead/Ea22-like family protein [Yersinia enterocolitica]HED5569205.1 ead/Ea22-like family protein [Yersinia enterocolitica]
MNNIEELKKAANAIGYEKWIDSAGEVTSVDYLAGGDVTCDHICNCETFNGESANAKFIALANPATILDLIDQLEAAQKERDEFRRRLKLERSILEDTDKQLAELKALQPVGYVGNSDLYALSTGDLGCIAPYNAFDGIPLFTAAKPAED